MIIKKKNTFSNVVEEFKKRLNCIQTKVTSALPLNTSWIPIYLVKI